MSWGPVALALLLLFFGLLKSFALGPAVSDENIYFYDAWLMTQGVWPYRDFFFAHPPMHLIPGWLLFSVTGFGLTVGKMLPMGAAAATGVGVYVIARRAGGQVAGVVAAALFLLSHDVLRASSHWTGINLSIAWLTWGLAAALAGRLRTAGVLFALGATTGFYVFPAALGVGVLLALKKARDSMRFGLAFLVPFLLINGFFWWLGGDGYLDGVYRYHALKPGLEGQTLFDRLPSILFHDFFLVAGPLYLLPLLRDAEQKTGRWCALLAAGYLVFLGLLGQVFHFYFLLLFPACAVCGGLFVGWATGSRRNALIAGAAVLVGFLVVPSFEYQLGYFARQRGKTKTYELPPSPLPGSGLVEALLWKPDRTIGRRHTGIQYYLWHESRRFDTARTMADRLKELAGPEDTLFGDSTSVPLVALWSGVPIATHMVDTNGMRFSSGITPPEEAIARLRGKVTWVLVHSRRGFYQIDELRRFVEEDFEPVQSFETRHHGTYRLLRQRGS